MSWCDNKNFMDNLRELINTREETSKKLFALENSLFKLEENFLRKNPTMTNMICRKGFEKSTRSSPNHFNFSGSSVTSGLAVDLAMRSEQLKRSKEVRLLSNGVSPQDSSSDTDPEEEGIEAFLEAARRDTELRLLYKQQCRNAESNMSMDTS